jgi:hypothetical protein
VRPLSEAWTAEDRLRVVAAMLPSMQSDIYAGRYSAPGRPNITSLQHVLHDAPAELEPLRSELQSLVDEAEGASS